MSHSLLCDGVVVKEDATVCPGSILSFKVPLAHPPLHHVFDRLNFLSKLWLYKWCTYVYVCTCICACGFSWENSHPTHSLRHHPICRIYISKIAGSASKQGCILLSPKLVDLLCLSHETFLRIEAAGGETAEYGYHLTIEGCMLQGTACSYT